MVYIIVLMVKPAARIAILLMVAALTPVLYVAAIWIIAALSFTHAVMEHVTQKVYLTH